MSRHETASACHQLGGVHVDLIQIRSFFTVDLNADEPFIHQLCNLLIFKTLLLHHMTPMAGRVADTEKDRLVLLPGSAQSLLSPGKPIHRIVGMLQKVRAGLVNQAIREPWLFIHPMELLSNNGNALL
jgi:hypothetical protein